MRDDAEFGVPRILNAPTFLLFWGKIICVGLGYWKLLGYLKTLLL
jgi:hypothetical protein